MKMQAKKPNLNLHIHETADYQGLLYQNSSNLWKTNKNEK